MVSCARARSGRVRKYENEGIKIFFLFPSLTLGFIHSKVFVLPTFFRNKLTWLYVPDEHAWIRQNIIILSKGLAFHPAPSFGARHFVGSCFSVFS